MRSNVTAILNTDPDYWLFLRQYPYWHQQLSRYPNKMREFMNEYKTKRRKRFIDKVENATMMMDVINKIMGE